MYKLTGNLTHTQTSLASKWYMTIPALQPKTTPGTPKTGHAILKQSKKHNNRRATPTFDTTHSDKQQGNQPATEPTSLTHEQ
jgi:hypothetical protein